MKKRTQTTVSAKIHQNRHIPDASLFVTVAAVSQALGFTTRTIRRMMEDGHLPGRKFRSEWRMHRADFAQLTKPQLKPNHINTSAA